MTRHIRYMTLVMYLVCLVSPAYATGMRFDVRESNKPNGPNATMQFNDSGVFSGDQGLVWSKEQNLLSISRDSGQTGLALAISSDTGATLAGISHDGIAYFENVEANNEVTADVAINVGIAGVRMTQDGDGAITFTGRGDGSDEDYTINFDDTANTIVSTSSTGVTEYRILQAAGSPRASVNTTSANGYSLFALQSPGDDWEIDLGGSTVSDIPHQLGFFNTSQNDIYTLVLSTDTAAVNYLKIKNANTNVSPDIAATGTDSNINVRIAPKGTGSLAVVKTTGTAQITMEGTLGGCLMYRDTDNAGWTECDALDGAVNCSVDADGLCD